MSGFSSIFFMNIKDWTVVLRKETEIGHRPVVFQQGRNLARLKV